MLQIGAARNSDDNSLVIKRQIEPPPFGNKLAFESAHSRKEDSYEFSVSSFEIRALRLDVKRATTTSDEDPCSQSQALS